MRYLTIFKIGILATSFTVIGCQQEALVAEVPRIEGGNIVLKAQFTSVSDVNNSIHRWNGKDLQFELRQGKNADENMTATFDTSEETLNAMVDEFAKLKGTTVYELLSSEYYDLPTSIKLKKGQISESFNIKIKDVENGTFILPLVLKNGGQELGIQFIEVIKTSELDIDMSWLDRIPTVEEPRIVAVIEASENDLRNVGNYILYPEGDEGEEQQKLKRPLFDMAIIFSANVNFNEGSQSPMLYYNKEIKRILDNRDVFVKPLQDKGIKVLLSLMPNHQGIGFSNLDITGERMGIKNFARDIAEDVKKYGLDGVMFDDEYADYPQNLDAVQPGRPIIQMGSFHFLIKELRDLMPLVKEQQWKDRHNLITLYNIGPSCSGAAGAYIENWSLFGNHFDIIKDAVEGSMSTKGWGDDFLKNLPGKKILRNWVQDPANESVLNEIAEIKAGEIFDFIWNSNYLRGDDHKDSPMSFPYPDDSEVGWFAGMDAKVASEKFGLASFEMSLELNKSNQIKHQDKFWLKASYPNPGRQEDLGTTLVKQKNANEKTLLFFNLQYIPNEWQGRIYNNIYLEDRYSGESDFGLFMRLLGNSKNPVVKFEGTNYGTVIPSYLR